MCHMSCALLCLVYKLCVVYTVGLKVTIESSENFLVLSTKTLYGNRVIHAFVIVVEILCHKGTITKGQ